MSLDRAVVLVDVFPGRAPVAVGGPIEFAASPMVTTGVDCVITPTVGRAVRAVGTFRSAVSITGGYVVQAGSWARLRPGTAGRRMAWSHYTSMPGDVELLGRADVDGIVEAFLTPPAAGPRGGHLNLGATGDRLLHEVHRKLSGGSAVVRSDRGRLRWAVLPGGPATALHIKRDGRALGAIRVGCPDPDFDRWPDLFADIARHDHLLGVVLRVVERTDRMDDRAEAYEMGRFALETLAHVWMPAARLSEPMERLWQAFDDRAGLTRQWRATIDRLRDRILVHALGQLGTAAMGG